MEAKYVNRRLVRALDRSGGNSLAIVIQTRGWQSNRWKRIGHNEHKEWQRKSMESKVGIYKSKGKHSMVIGGTVAMNAHGIMNGSRSLRIPIRKHSIQLVFY